MAVTKLRLEIMTQKFCDYYNGPGTYGCQCMFHCSTYKTQHSNAGVIIGNGKPEAAICNEHLRNVILTEEKFGD